MFVMTHPTGGVRGLAMVTVGAPLAALDPGSSLACSIASSRASRAMHQLVPTTVHASASQQHVML